MLFGIMLRLDVTLETRGAAHTEIFETFAAEVLGMNGQTAIA